MAGAQKDDAPSGQATSGYIPSTLGRPLSPKGPHMFALKLRLWYQEPDCSAQDHATQGLSGRPCDWKRSPWVASQFCQGGNFTDGLVLHPFSLPAAKELWL